MRSWWGDYEHNKPNHVTTTSVVKKELHHTVLQYNYYMPLWCKMSMFYIKRQIQKAIRCCKCLFIDLCNGPQLQVLHQRHPQSTSCNASSHNVRNTVFLFLLWWRKATLDEHGYKFVCLDHIQQCNPCIHMRALNFTMVFGFQASYCLIKMNITGLT